MPNQKTLPMICAVVLVTASGCGRAPDPGGSTAITSPSSVAGATSASVNEVATLRTAGDVDFPVIPQIIVPDIVGVGPAQRALESSMQGLLNPIAGISVRPANCATDGALINDAGINSVDEQGNLLRNGDEGIFAVNADGSGTANFEGGIVSINADGSGTINGSGAEGADEGIISIEADGSGTYNGKYGIIELDGKGAGTWNGDSGLIDNHGDGSGTWNGPSGLITIEKDGSGTWNGPAGLITNHGDGTGEVGTPSRAMKMAPIPNLAPAGRFPPLKKFAMPGAPCGFVISLEDRVLFDFDKSNVRPDASKVLNTLASALQQVKASSMEIRGHTDSKGEDDYNQSLSDKRAQAVVDALRARGAAKDASARGYGESQPVAPNALNGHDNPDGRQLNRRVEIFVRT